MKKVYLLLLFLCFSSTAFSQQKSEFGFVVKGGNYAIPSKRNTPESFFFNSDNNVITHQAGSVYTIGIWHSVPLGHVFRLSGEFLYRSISFSGEHKSAFSFIDGIAPAIINSTLNQKMNESSISIPVKLHFPLKKEGRISFAIGGGISRVFYSNFISRSVTQSNHPTLGVEPDRIFVRRLSSWDDFNTSLSLTAGLHYRIDKKTAFGLDYTFENAASRYYDISDTFLFCDCICDCSGYSSQLRTNMNSFSVSLRHNILD